MIHKKTLINVFTESNNRTQVTSAITDQHSHPFCYSEVKCIKDTNTLKLSYAMESYNNETLMAMPLVNNRNPNKTQKGMTLKNRSDNKL